jgi:hypothetical protein
LEIMMTTNALVRGSTTDLLVPHVSSKEDNPFHAMTARLDRAARLHGALLFDAERGAELSSRFSPRFESWDVTLAT